MYDIVMSSVKSFIPLSVIHLCIYSQPDVNIARLNLFQSIGIPHQTQPDQDPKHHFFLQLTLAKVLIFDPLLVNMDASSCQLPLGAVDYLVHE